MTAALSTSLRRSGRGVVVTVGSVAGKVSFPGLATYGAAKAGVIHFTRTAAREFLDSGVRTFCVCPGIVETGLQPSAELTALRETTPHKRLQSPDEIAAIICEFSKEAYRSITGAVIDCDDGVGLLAGGSPAPSIRVPVERSSAAAGASSAAFSSGPHPLMGQVAALVAETFGVSVASVDVSTGPDAIARWDSLGHLRLIAALEKTFSVSLNADDAMELMDVGSMLRILDSKDRR